MDSDRVLEGFVAYSKDHRVSMAPLYLLPEFHHGDILVSQGFRSYAHDG